MAKDAETTPRGLSFPHATFAKLTPNAYLQAHLKQPNIVRPNGRTIDQFREPVINTGSLAYSNGSAVVRLGDTSVVCGVRGEILLTSDIPLPPKDNIAEAELVQQLGLLVPNLELSTGCSPAHLPGNPPSSLAQSLTWRLYSLLHTSDLIDIKDLQIQHEEPALEEGDDTRIVTKAYWTLYLDILCISLDGNCFDAAWIAILAALCNTRLPQAAWNADREMIMCSPKSSDARSLSLRTLPVSSTFASFSTSSPLKDSKLAEAWTLADPDTFEEDACTETATITVDSDATVRIEKSGGPSLTAKQLRHCLALAHDRRRQVVALIEAL